jgi:hypothetical protein
MALLIAETPLLQRCKYDIWDYHFLINTAANALTNLIYAVSIIYVCLILHFDGIMHAYLILPISIIGNYILKVDLMVDCRREMVGCRAVILMDVIVDGDVIGFKDSVLAWGWGVCIGALCSLSKMFLVELIWITIDAW